MSTESSISENIEEDISADDKTNEGTNEETQNHNSQCDRLDTFAKSQLGVLENEQLAADQSHDKGSLVEHQEFNTSEANKKRTYENEVGLDSNAVKRQVIEKFSSDEAEKIIKEAILIKHVLDEDKSQFDTNNKVEIDKITGERRQGGEGYDRYIMDKLLHSEPDPSEEPFEQIERIDAGLKDVENILDNTEERNGEESDMSDAETEISKDKSVSNNSILHKDFDLTDAFGENALQTIDEDKELNLYDDVEEEQVNHSDEGTLNEKSKTQLDEEIAEEPQTTTHTEPGGEEIVSRADDFVDAHEEEIESLLEWTHPNLDSKWDRKGHHQTDTTQNDNSHTEQDNQLFPNKVNQMVENDGLVEIETESSEDEEEDIGEMTYKQKKAVVAAVRRGNIDLLEDLLDKRHADINMLWYNENLIMVAIRAGQEQMAEFLIDNDLDVTHTTKLIERTEKGEITTYPQTIREMAADKNMEDLVELIDLKTNNLFSFIKPKQREIRIRRPRPPTPPTPEEPSEDDFTTEDGSQAGEVTSALEDLILTKEKLQKFERDLDSGLNSSNNAELDRKHSVTKSNRVHSESHVNSGGDTHRESIAESEGSQISRVFGMDEGYETMSPVSPMCALNPSHHEQNTYGAKEHVSIRGTRASHSAKMHTFKTLSNMNHCAKDNNMKHSMRPGSHYNRESKRWHQTKSAPTMRTRQSFESIPEIVRTGVPFAHGDKKTQTQTVSNFHGPVISPYSQVARMLSGSRLLKPKSASSLPSIHNDRTNRADKVSLRTETEYIYADRNNPTLYDRISFIHQPRVSTVGPGLNRPRNAW